MKQDKYFPLFFALISIGCFGYVWSSTVRFQADSTAAQSKNVSAVRASCASAVGSWQEAGESYENARQLSLPTQQEILPPVKATAPAVEIGQFRRSRCILNIKGKVDFDTPAWLQIPSVGGDSAVYVNDIFRDYVHPDLNFYGTLLPSELRDELEIDVISVRFAPETKNLGMTQVAPILMSNDFKLLDEIYKSEYGASFALKYGRINIFIGLALVLLTVWISGLRYADIGWILVTMAAICIQAAFVPEGNNRTPEMGWRSYQLIYAASMFSLLGYSLAFLRLKEWEERFRSFFVILVVAVTAIFYILERKFDMPRNVFVPAISGISAAGFVLCCKEAIDRVKATTGSRRLNLQIYAALATLTALAFTIQAAGLTGTGNIGALVQPAVTLVLGTFLGIDLVLFHRRLSIEQDNRQIAQHRNQILAEQMTLGQSVQMVLLPPLSVHESNVANYTFSYRPQDHMAGDWAACWESENGFNVLAGRVGAKGAPAAVAMATVLGLLQDAKNFRMELADAINMLHQSIRALFHDQLKSTWSGLIVNGTGNLYLANGGSIGWLVWDGKDIKRHVFEGESIGDAQIQSFLLTANSYAEWRVAVTVSNGVCPNDSAIKKAEEILLMALASGQEDAEIIEMLFAINSKDNSQQHSQDDQSIIVVRRTV